MLWKKNHVRMRVCFYLGECSLIESYCFWLYYCCLYEVCALCSVSWMCCFIHIMFLVFCTLFVIWVFVMLIAYLILSDYCLSSCSIAYSTYYVSVAYDFLVLTWFLFLWLSEISLFHILIPESNQTDVCTLWYCIWFFAVCLFSCRWLVVTLKAKTL